MAHNIIQPRVGGQYTRLVINDDCDEVEVRFFEKSVVLLASEGVLIEGEDLYALRELLNELPEEAFVRPVEAARWNDGDIILWDDASTYVREEGFWYNTGSDCAVPDRVMSEGVDRHPTVYRVLRQKSTQ